MSDVFPPRGLNSTAPFNPAVGITLAPQANTFLRPPTKASAPFISANHRPSTHDGVCRVVVVSPGGSGILPMIAALTKDPGVSVQIVATDSSFTQESVDAALRAAWDTTDVGLRIWTDADEKSEWGRDTTLHQELRRWADAVLVAPCSADMLAKIACGLSDNLGLSLLRALPTSTPVIVCPAMNADMYANVFTAKHVSVLRDELHHVVLQREPRGPNPGAMRDWRDIVIALQDMAALYHMRQQQRSTSESANGDMAVDDMPSAPDTPSSKARALGDWAGDRSTSSGDTDGIPKPFWVFRPIWGEASPIMFNSPQSFMQPVPGLPSQRSEVERQAERHLAATSAHPNDLPISNAEEIVRVMSTAIYGEQRQWAV